MSHFNLHNSTSDPLPPNPQRLHAVYPVSGYNTPQYYQGLKQSWSKCYNQPLLDHNNIFRAQQNHSNLTGVANARQAWAEFDHRNQQRHKFKISFRTEAGEQAGWSRQTQGSTNYKQNEYFRPRQIEIDVPKPPPFMGAFRHIQPSQNLFRLNVVTPQPQNRLFSSLYEDPQPMKEEIPNPYLGVSSISRIKEIDKGEQSRGKYFFQIESVQSQEERLMLIEENRMNTQENKIGMEASKIGIQNNRMGLQTSKIESGENQQQQPSILWNYQQLFRVEGQYRRRSAGWQDQEFPQTLKQSKYFEVYIEHAQLALHQAQLQLNTAQQLKVILTDKFVLGQISKMMQNVQCQLFSLDYGTRQWRIQLGKYRLEHDFRSSFKPRMKDALDIACKRSRIDVAMQYIRTRKFRKIYYQLSLQVQQILINFEQVVLMSASNSTFMQFMLQLDKLKIQIDLIYSILLNQQYIKQDQRSFDDFDYRFLNSEYIIFKEITKLTKFSDSVNMEIRPMLVRMQQAVFKPILAILSQLLFEQATAIQMSNQVYLKYYFQSCKELLVFVSKKLGLIKKQNNELYLICKMKEQMAVHYKLQSLQQYEHRWENCFERKRKMIQKIRKGYRAKLQIQRQKRYQEKVKSLEEIKTKMEAQRQEQIARKRQKQAKVRAEFQRQQRQLKAIQERKKLIQELQKQKEKGALLNAALKQKQALAKQKEQLERQLKNQSMDVQPQVIQNNTKNAVQTYLVEDRQGQVVVQIVPQQSDKSDKKPLVQPVLDKNWSIQSQNNIIQGAEVNSKRQLIESEQQVQSKKSISKEDILAKSSDLLLKRREKSSIIIEQDMARTMSYFKLKQKQSILSQSDSQMQKSQQSIQQQNDYEGGAVALSFNKQIDLSTCLSICVNDIISQQIGIVQETMKFLIIQKYQIWSIVQFMRLVFMSGDGQKTQEFIRLCIGTDSVIHLKHFNQCLLLDTPLQNIQKLQPAFYQTHSSQSQINLFEDRLWDHIGFQFQKLPSLLEPYFSYIHLSKYIQIFSFVIKLKHCASLVNLAWKTLNSYNKQLRQRQRKGQDVSAEMSMAHILYSVRYFITNFLVTFQNYFFMKVISKQVRVLRMMIKDLNELQANHHKMLDNIIFYGFIDRPNKKQQERQQEGLKISEKFSKVLRHVQEFYQIVLRLSIDDLPSFKWQETQQRVQLISNIFKSQQKNIQNLIFKTN